MKIGPIDSSRIEAMAARLQAAARAPAPSVPAVLAPTMNVEGTKVSFSGELRAMLDRVN